MMAATSAPRSAYGRHWPNLSVMTFRPRGWLAPKVIDGRFDLYVAVNGRSDWHDLE